MDFLSGLYLQPVGLGHELGSTSNSQKTFEFYNANLFLKRDLTHSTAKLYAYTYFGTHKGHLKCHEDFGLSTYLHSYSLIRWINYSLLLYYNYI